VAVPKLDLDDIQGLVARGYGGLAHARFTVFAVGDPAAGRALLSWLLPRVTTAGKFSGDTALHVAFTSAGLRRLGLPESVVAGFSAEFIAGMTAADKSRFLGDVEDSDPRSWAWGGPLGPPVDGMVLLYAADLDILNARQAELTKRLAEAGVRDVAVLDTRELADHEPFGFRDGISQPVIEGLPGVRSARTGPATTGPARTGRATTGPATTGRTTPAGEFVLGYPNAYGQLTDRPLLPASDDPRHLLPRDPAGTGAADLGRNGTYLVLRQLEQDVDGFWQSMRRASQRPDGSASPGAEVALAAKMVGRWPSGAPLVEAPDRDDPALSQDNDFGYHATDPLGLACPLGAHIRRVNPRDSMDPQPGTAASVDVSDRHRLLRRARSYGPADGGDTPAAATLPARGGTAPPGDTPDLDGPDPPRGLRPTPDLSARQVRLATAAAVKDSASPGGTTPRDPPASVVAASAAAVKDNYAKRLTRGDTARQRGTGLYFLCLVGSLSRQFEFVQHTWLNNPTFNGLYDDTDPLAGSRHGTGGTFTAPARPVRRRYRDLPQFVRTRGGAYFFLPGLSALRYMAQLPGTIPSSSATR
jgi:deferrochelatase/peroxidase EfeB